MLKALAILFSLVYPFMLCAQHNVKGRVLCGEQPLSLASISVRDSVQIIATRLSEQDGTFLLSLPAGKYQLEVSLIGYKIYTTSVTIPAPADLLVVMEQESRQLSAVSISGSKPLIERKLDRIIFNVPNSIMASGGSAWEALAKAPGVRTTTGGNVTAMGKGAVIYINNRILRLSGEDLVSFLQGQNADNIQRIEVIVNPPASYDAQGGAVINIVTKKILAGGLNAVISGGITQSALTGGRLGSNFNYRKGKWNVYGGLAGNISRKDYREDNYIVFGLPDSYSYWKGVKEGQRRGETVAYKLGADFAVNSRHVVGFMLDGATGNRERPINIRTDVYQPDIKGIDSLLTTHNTTGSTINQQSVNFNYSGSLDTGGTKTINVDVDISPFRNRKNQDIDFASYKPESSRPVYREVNNTRSLQDISILSGRIDYSQQWNKDWRFETGIKYNRTFNKSDLRFYNLDNNIPHYDTLKSSEFHYTEKNLALYVNMQGAIGKLSVETGLRGEYTWTTGYLVTKDLLNERNYFKLFPTVFITYAINDKHEVNAYYGRRINRPDYWRLNPFRYYTSPYTYLEGNPYLRPAFVNEIELGYSFKKHISITLFYNDTRDYFSNISIQDNTQHIFYDTQRNLNQSLETGMHATIPYTPFSWWEINAFLQASYKKEKSGFLDSKYNYSTWFAYVNLTQAFTISRKAGWKGEITTWYASPGIQGIYRIAANYDVSFGVRKMLWGGKGSVQLSVADIFYSNFSRIDVDYENQRNGFREKTDTRAVTLNFNYKIGNKKIAATRSRKTSNEDEKKRATN
ncbi:MAG: TonB-dependent receptor [Chitinophaga sp.]|uniref:outer membrane beta-barrel protein n=1 Tax=Chitinophaga sp. TaxID=1869181 RepID=UPI001B0DAA2C|nr:outer membrane beta-barrel protein [Chitinophaga sp.]MBO9732447.1 TonB-dependent receptor [Chitinophaga sp.]